MSYILITDPAGITAHTTETGGVDLFDAVTYTFTPVTTEFAMSWAFGDGSTDTSTKAAAGGAVTYAYAIKDGTSHTFEMAAGTEVISFPVTIYAATPSRIYVPIPANVDTASTNYAVTYPVLVLADTGAGGFNVTLPAAATMKGDTVMVKKTSGDGNTVTVVPAGAEKIDGAANKTITTQYVSYTLVSDGTGWDLA